MADVRSEGARSVAAREIIGSLIISGDHNQVFQCDYAKLGEVYIDHASVFARLDVDHFIGRDALIRDIDAFIAREPSGYIVIEAEPGLGKSALLGALVRRRGYIHHFVELTPGPLGIAPALKSLAAQIVRAYDLNPFGVIPAAAAQPHYFQSLLGQASERAQAQAQGQRVVVVIDGLDQAAAPEGHNVLGLPTSLPNGVFLIVSHQPVAIALRAPEVRRLVRTLTAQSKENLDDMRGYLEGAADRLTALKRVSRDGFVEQMLRKCDGRWQQMVLIVREIASGARSPTELDTIPNGLTQEYCARYRRYADSMPADRWANQQRPLLAAIAAAEEPVSLAMLNAWMGRTVTQSELAPLVRGGRHGLLVVDDQQKQLSRYRPEHVSVRDFLHGRVDRHALTTTELATLDEAVEATRAAHDHVASFYLRRFDASTRDDNIPLDDYGLTHVITHLEEAHRHADAIALLSRERVAQHRVRARAVRWLPLYSWKTVETRHHLWTELRTQRGTWVDVANDIKRLWTIEDDRLDRLPAPDLRTPLRLALLHASIMGRINAITPTLASELVRLGVWSPQQSLAFGLSARPGRWNRHNRLTALAEALAARGDAEEALAAAYMIDVGAAQAKALGKIATLLPSRLQGELLNRLRRLLRLPPHVLTGMREEIADGTPYGVASVPGDIVASVAPGLSADAAAQAIEFARPLPPLSRVFAWAPLFERLAPAARAALIAEALTLAQTIHDEHSRMLAFARLAADLPDDDRRRAVDAVVTAIDGEQDEHRRSVLIDLLRPVLLQIWPPERVCALLQRHRSVIEQLTTILTRERHPDRYFVRFAVECASFPPCSWSLFAAASPYLDPGERDEALVLARTHQWPAVGLDLVAPLPEADRFTSQTWIIETLAEYARSMSSDDVRPELPRLAALGRLDTALALARSIGPAHARGKTLAELVRYVPGRQQRPLLDEALSLVCSIDDERQRRAIEAASEMERGRSRHALTMLRKLRSRANRELFADFAERLADRGEPELAVEALVATSDYFNTRLEAFSRIAQRIPEPLLRRALTAWNDLGDRRNKMIAQAIAAAYATGPGAADALNARLDALFKGAQPAQELVIAHLPSAHVAPLLDRVLTEPDKTRVPLVNLSAELVAALVPRLSDAPSLRRLLYTVWEPPEMRNRYESGALTAIRLIEQEHVRELEQLAADAGTLRTQKQVLDRIATFITDEPVLELLATRESWRHDPDWAPAIAELAAFFARRGQGAVAVTLLNTIHEYYRTESRLVLVGLLPGGEFAAFWKEALHDVTQNDNATTRPKQLRALVPVLREFPMTTLDVVLRATLRNLAMRPRDKFLDDLRALLPIVAAVGGDDALQAIIQGCADVGRWFP